MLKVNADASSLKEKLIEPEFSKFYSADLNLKNDQLLEFSDWKILGSGAYPQATE